MYSVTIVRLNVRCLGQMESLLRFIKETWSLMVKVLIFLAVNDCYHDFIYVD